MKKYVIFGLGNYDPEYSFTRHNIASDYLYSSLCYLRAKEKKEYLLFEEISDEKEIWYIIPKSYMNTCGTVFLEEELRIAYKNKSIEKTLILHDDLDIDFEKVKLRTNPERGHRGHNGCRSLLEYMKKNNLIPSMLPFFLSIGIGRPDETKQHDSVSSWVLKKYNPSEKKIINERVFPQIQKTILTWLNQ